VVLGVPIPAEPALALVGIAFEVGARGIEEKQVDLEVEQVRHGEEHCFLDLGLGVSLHQQVHRPIRLVLIHPVQARDRHVVSGPLRGGELGGRVDGPVRDEREQHPLHIRGEPPGPEDAPQRGVDAELAPQPVQQVRGAHRA
jgi:hypothetical protein